MAMEAGHSPESLFSPISEGDSSSLLLIDKINDSCNDDEMDIIDRIALRRSWIH